MTRRSIVAIGVLCAMTVLLCSIAVTEAAFPIANHPTIETVTGQNFRESVVDPTLPVVIHFWKKNKACKNFAPLYEEVAEKLKGYALFRVMDADTEEGQGLGEMFGVKSAPAVLLFNPELLPVAGGQEGQYMKAPLQFQGQFSVHHVTKFVFMATASHQLERLEDLQDAEDFIAKYKMQDVPKTLLFFNDDVVPPMYKAASHAHRYGMIFAVVNVTTPEAQEVADRFGVTVIPSVVTVAGEETEILADEPAGTVTVESLTNFVGRASLDKEKKMQLQGYFIESEIANRKKAQEEAKMNKALPPTVITTEAEWKKHCFNRKKGYCVAVFVENVNEVDMDMLTETGRKMAQRTTSASQIAVIDGQANYDIAEYYSATNGFPEVVFINPSKKGYHNLIGAYNTRSMVNFFADKVTSTRGKKYDPKVVPAFQRSAVPEQSEDGAISDEL